MGVSRRLVIRVFAFVLLSMFVVAPSGHANKNPCDNCGNSCWMDYQPGWSDCGGSPAGCLRVVVC